VIARGTRVDTAQVREVTARAGVFRREEVECLWALWDDYLANGPQLSGYTFIVERDGEHVLGYACYGARDLADGVFDLYWIAVDPDARRRGIGRGLLAAAEQAVRSEHGRMLVAETSGTPAYDATRAFYERMGYDAEARIRDFYVPGDDLVIYIKRF
jgi:ribosomal protein S18 acetylase RimI-like enzyme